MTRFDETDGAPAELPRGLAGLLAEAGEPARPRPVEQWNPPDCGPIDMRIAADGTWFYRGTPIGREALVRLFASILRCDPDGGHVLVTPVEKLHITVEDAPFVAVEVVGEGEGDARRLTFRTNVGDVVAAGPDHPLRFVTEPRTEGLKPYLHVRGRLEALATRAVAWQLVGFGDEEGGVPGVWSGGVFFPFPSPVGEHADG